MDAFVSSFVSSADGLIYSVGQSGFGAVLQAVNGIAASCAILAICFLVLNQFLQVQYISLNRFLGLFIKLLLISVIGLRWSNFSAVAESIQTGMDQIGAKLLTMAAPTSSTTVAGAIDNIINIMAEKADEVGSKAAWFAGAIMSFGITVVLSVLGGVGAMIIIYSKVMFAVFICIAPIFITCFIFETTKDYFFRWLQGAITYTLYPVITAAVIGMSYSVIMTFINNNQSFGMETVASFIPFLSVTLMMIIMIVFIPVIVSGLSGMIQNVNPAEMYKVAQNMIQRKKDPNQGNSANSNNQPANSQSQQQNSSPSYQGATSRMLARANRIRGK